MPGDLFDRVKYLPKQGPSDLAQCLAKSITLRKAVAPSRKAALRGSRMTALKGLTSLENSVRHSLGDFRLDASHRDVRSLAEKIAAQSALLSCNLHLVQTRVNIGRFLKRMPDLKLKLSDFAVSVKSLPCEQGVGHDVVADTRTLAEQIRITAEALPTVGSKSSLTSGRIKRR